MRHFYFFLQSEVFLLNLSGEIKQAFATNEQHAYR